MFSANLRNYLAKKHIAGSQLNDALSVCRLNSAKKWGTVMSVWTDNEDKNIYVNDCLDVCNTIAKEKLDCYLSIKPASISFDIYCFKRIADAAELSNIRIHFDSLTYDLAEKSFEFLKKAKVLYPNVGYTLPARWKRSIKDAEEISKLKIPVRIVKGQWSDPENDKINTRSNFLEIAKRLANNVTQISIATHDRKLAKKTILQLKQANHYKTEIEQFFSLPLTGKKLAAKNDVKLRIYVPYGVPYLPYNFRFVYERPAMFSWMLRDLFSVNKNWPGLLRYKV